MSIKASQVPPKQIAFVRGTISYSRLAAHITGADLARRIEQARARGSKYPTSKPHTTISILDPQILGVTDPNNPTEIQQYVAGQIYQLKNGDNAGRNSFSVDDKSPDLPVIVEPVDPATNGGNSHAQLVLENDLASGLDVTIVLESFRTKDQENTGVGIQQIILNEAPRYYSGGIDTSALQAIGVTIAGGIRRVSAADSPALANQAAAQEALPGGATISPDGHLVTPPQPQAQAQAQAQPAAYAQPAAAPAPVGNAAQEAELAQLRAQLAAQQAPAAAPVVDPVQAELDALRAQVAGQQVASAPAAPVATPNQEAELAQLRAQQAALLQQGQAQGTSPFDAAPQPGIGFGPSA